MALTFTLDPVKPDLLDNGILVLKMKLTVLNGEEVLSETQLSANATPGEELAAYTANFQKQAQAIVDRHAKELSLLADAKYTGLASAVAAAVKMKE